MYGQPALVGATTTSGLAIAALILGICGAFPIALLLSVVFGIMALVQLKRTGAKGRGLAIGGLAASGVWAVAWVVSIGLIAGNKDLTATPTPTVTIPHSTPKSTPRSTPTNGDSNTDLTPLSDLKSGDCIQDVTEGKFVTTLLVVPCSASHEAEVVGKVTLPSGAYPGEKAVDDASIDKCTSAMEAYAPGSSDNEAISLFYFPPGEDDWDTDRSVICMAYQQKATTASIKK
jgi:hypothetical protein